jgi:hypothetical protein
MSRPSTRDHVLAIGSAIVLSAATLWTVAIDARITVDSPPEWVRGTDYGVFLESWYAWQSGTLGQERAALALLCVGLAAVAVSALRLARGGGTARLSASLAVAAGALCWALVSVAQAGGRHAVEQMAASGNQIDAVNSIAFTVDTSAGWLHAAACALLASGLLGLVTARASALWRAVCAAAGATGCLFAALLLAESDTAKYAGLLLGAVLLPLWIVATWSSAHDDAPESSAANVDVRRGDEPAPDPAPAATTSSSTTPPFPFRSFR